MPSFFFTNPNRFHVNVYSVARSGTYLETWGLAAPETKTVFVLSYPPNTEVRFAKAAIYAPSPPPLVVVVEQEILFDNYRVTGADDQTHAIRDVSTQLEIINNSSSSIFLFTVDSSGKETPVEGLSPKAVFRREDDYGALKPSTTWRVKDAAGNSVKTYATTEASRQQVEIPAGPLQIEPIIAVLSVPITIYSGPIDNSPIAIPPERNTPYTLACVKDSIFNFDTWSFNWDVFDLEWSIRGRLPDSANKDEIRAGVYAGMMALAGVAKDDRTPKEQAVLDWLAGQVKQTRIAAAQLALEEHDRWHRDPWNYQPPPGNYGFPAYSIATRNSPTWLFTTPPPPVLQEQSFASFLAGIISSNGWSPINNPIILKGNKKVRGLSSLEGVVGFPVFGAARLYGKLYNDGDGGRVLVNTMAHSIATTFNLLPVTAMGEVWRHLGNLRALNMQALAPNSYRAWQDAIGMLSLKLGIKTQYVPEVKGIARLTEAELRDWIEWFTTGNLLFRSVATFVVTVALQALISETVSFISKLNLRPDLIRHLEEKKSDPLPDLENLLYYDTTGRDALFGADYKPEGQEELERFMGGAEVFRSFLLATT